MWIVLVGLGVSPFALILIIYLTVRFAKPPLDFKYDDRPLLFFLYLKALYLGLHEKQGVFKDAKPIPEGRLQVIARDCRLDPGNLRKYAELCGFGKTEGMVDNVPTCYLESYFITLMIVIATSEHFKLSPLGLIHISQSITQHTCLQHLYKEPFDLECSVVEYRPTERGIEVDLSMKVYDRREMCIWEGMATLLSRKIDSLRNRSKVSEEKELESDNIRKNEEFTLDLPSNKGMQFAWVSGDCNPHHLWQWTAKMLGYQKPIVQGMWTLSRSLAFLHTTGIFQMRPPFHIVCRFKRPIFLPGTSVFKLKPRPNKDVYWFSVTDKATSDPQLQGTITRS